MKKNRMMRLASVLLVCVLLTTSVISGTIAKYTTRVTSSDKARVAYWGFQTTNSMDITDLFDDVYTHNVNGETVKAVNGEDLIAPGTAGEAKFTFAWDESVNSRGNALGVTGPEVAYTFAVGVEGYCEEAIKNNTNIVWALNPADINDPASYGSWDKMIDDIKALSGDASGSMRYEANTLPTAFGEGDPEHTIAWMWLFDANDNDAVDTNMGNAQNLATCSIKITITATQID